MAWFVFIGTILGAYLVGSVPVGFLVAHWRGVNIFKHGSGNIGATNVGRVLGRRLGVLVFVLDFAKGAIPVAAALWLADWCNDRLDVSISPATLGVGAGLAAFLGHLFPIYLLFRGGKGVATGAGVIVVLVPGPALAALVAWVGVVLATRTISLASLAAALTLCDFQLLTPGPFTGDNLIISLFCLVAACLVFARHHANIARLWHGTENRLPEGAAMVTLSKTIHVLALGLWLGMIVFFMIVALIVFDQLESLALERAGRPWWFPVNPSYSNVKQESGINSLLEQGTRAAGYALSPVFGWYFLIQGLCGFLAAATALPWPRLEPGRRIHRVRVGLLVAALATVVIAWPLDQKVDQLREPRHEAMDRYLEKPNSANLEAAVAARKEFGMWHGFSLMLNFGTLVLVFAALALAAQLPARPVPAPVPGSARPDETGPAADPNSRAPDRQPLTTDH
jgi:glycerol-3-phosphate acyltransferase PlsY